MGVFYVAILPAELLLDVAFSDALSATYVQGDATYTLDGTQRLPQPKRLDPIANYIDRPDAAFPNSIILAANYRKEDGLNEDDADDDQVNSDTQVAPDQQHLSRRWAIEGEEEDGRCTLVIPTNAKLASVIDGQHRLFAFTRALASRRQMELVCSIFLDLPKPFQAQLFATINSTQKPVDKSLTFELFGYNIADEEEQYWSPDKVAVFLARKLGLDESSPLKGKVVIAPKKDAILARLAGGTTWTVSTAVVVEGIERLFTTNPKADTANLLRGDRKKRADIADSRKDKSPLRELYLKCNDAAIYQVVLNYLKACERVFWSKAQANSYITKTVGVQALFDVLRRRIQQINESRDIRTERFQTLLAPAGGINFAEDRFRNASGSGRSFIRRTIEEAIGRT